MAEWSMATDLKSVRPFQGLVGSNPTPTASVSVAVRFSLDS